MLTPSRRLPRAGAMRANIAAELARMDADLEGRAEV